MLLAQQPAIFFSKKNIFKLENSVSLTFASAEFPATLDAASILMSHVLHTLLQLLILLPRTLTLLLELLRHPVYHTGLNRRTSRHGTALFFK